MPGPSFAPFLGAIGVFFLGFGLVAGGLWTLVGAVILAITLLYWGREALRDYDTAAAHDGGAAVIVGALQAPAGIAARRRPHPGAVLPPAARRGRDDDPRARAGPRRLGADPRLHRHRRHDARLAVGRDQGVPARPSTPTSPATSTRAATRRGPRRRSPRSPCIVVAALVLSSNILPNSGGRRGAERRPGGERARGRRGPAAQRRAADRRRRRPHGEGHAVRREDAHRSPPASRSSSPSTTRTRCPHDVEIKDASGARCSRARSSRVRWSSSTMCPPSPPGQYTFVCTVHPNMTGTATAG